MAGINSTLRTVRNSQHEGFVLEGVMNFAIFLGPGLGVWRLIVNRSRYPAGQMSGMEPNVGQGFSRDISGLR